MGVEPEDRKGVKQEPDEIPANGTSDVPNRQPERLASGQQHHKSTPTIDLAVNKSERTDSPAAKDEEQVVRGAVSLVQEPGERPKLAHTAATKIKARQPQLFAHLPDATDEAQSGYDVMTACTYANKYLGTTDHAMECDCTDEWGMPHMIPPLRVLGREC